jgi:two-component system response regulator NreC
MSENNNMFTLFLADDHTIIRQGLKRIIEENPRHRVIGETGDGLDIVPKLRQLNPDMIILDLSMPNLNGIEAIRKIRRFNKKIKILILTMHKNDEYVYECLVNGAQGYVLKEDADTELLSAITSIQRNNIFISPSFTSDVIKKLVQHNSLAASKKKKPIYQDLTPREREILKLVAEGNSNKKIADKLHISIRTVEHHRQNVMNKVGVQNTASLVRYAFRNKIIE